MQRHTLTINDIPYLVEHYKSSEMTIQYVQEYVMLRKYEITNDIALDTDITFIPTSEYSNLINDDYIENESSVFLCKNNVNTFYSTSILDFSTDSSLKSLKYNPESSDIKYDYYELYSKNNNNDFEKFKCKCDKIRIYKPHSRKKLDFIISISNYINNIHFNYFCKRLDSLETFVSKETKKNNLTYYEYVEFLIPNIEYLFGSKNVYYNEDLNIHQLVKYAYGYNETKILNKESSKILLRNLILPYTIEKLCLNSCYDCQNLNDCVIKDIKNTYAKTFLVDDIYSIEYTNSDYNYFNIPFVLTCTHYDNIDETTGHYLSNAGISPSSLVLLDNNQFFLKSKIDFDENNKFIISVINRWNYPEIVDNNGKIMSLKDSYFYLNKITNTSEYDDFNGHDDDVFLSNFSEEFIESLSFSSAGCVIEMAIDLQFKHVFYRKNASMNDGIDDFAFNLDGIFVNWKEYPDIIFVRTMFIDKFLSKIFFSNVMTLTKEKFKYCINYTEENNYRLSLQEMKEFNFIDKINCIVNRHEIMAENVQMNSKLGNSKIIYKTVFYKTQDAQRIKIRTTVAQNIGINLGDYLSKVENFKLMIEGYEFVECARNDVYVIFKIPGTFITNSSGKYDIVNAEDDTYITSGTYETC